jgi:oligoendopeptidase F
MSILAGSESIVNAVDTKQASAAGPHAAGVRWDLRRIFSDNGAAREALQQSLENAAAFERQHRDRVAGLSVSELASALEALGAVKNDFTRVDQYVDLRFSIDSRDVSTKDLMDACFKAREEIQNRTRFFDLEWQAIPRDRAQTMAAEDELSPYRHYLEKLTAYAPHMRTEAEESMLTARDAAAVAEWQKLFAENLDKIEVDFDSGKGTEPHTLDRLLANSRNPSREIRFAAYETAFAQLVPRADVQSACYNAIVGDRLQMDKIRHFESPMQPTNLANDLPDAAVEVLVDSIEARYPLAQRWFRAKARILGLPKLHLYDQYAPLGIPREIDFPTAWRTFAEGTTRFSPRVAAVLEPFLDQGRLDAEPRTGKRGGAFCAPVAWGDDPYILMNFTDDARSVETIAHEAGHGLHFILAGQAQRPLSAGMGLAIAEVASTFHEAVLLDYVLEREDDPQQRRLMTAGEIEGAFAVVFRQSMMTRYERRAYAMKAGGMALTAERLSEIWMEENGKYYGDAVELPDAYRLGWAYIPHFIDVRFYTYAYSFAHLASMALYARYREEGPSFIPKYLDILAAGGSQSPQQLLGRVGIDITQPDWVAPSFAEIERMIDVAEADASDPMDISRD